MDSVDKYILSKQFEIEYRTFEAEASMRPHFHNSYELCFFEEGKRNIVIDDRMYVVNQNDVMLIKPNVIHGNVSGENYARTVIYFTEEYLRKYYTAVSIEKLTKCFDKGFVTLTSRQFATVKNILGSLMQENMDSESNYIFAYLAQLALILSEAEKQRGKNPVNNTLTELMSYIRKNFLELQGLEELSEEFGVSKEYICRMFKKNMQCTVSEYLNSFKIQKACRMLIDTKKTITDIGFECGFNSTMYFCRVFKRNIGISPNEYRKNRSI